MKMQAPDQVGNITIDNIEYERAADGTYEIADEHVDTAQMHGLKPYDPNAPEDTDEVAERIPSDFDDLHAKLSDTEQHVAQLQGEVASLQEQLRETGERAERAEAALAAAQPHPGTDDTSSSTGGTSSQQQDDADAAAATAAKLDAALADNPNFDDMSRDQMVEWLDKNADVKVSVSISKVDARAKIDEVVAAHKAAKGE